MTNNEIIEMDFFRVYSIEGPDDHYIYKITIDGGQKYINARDFSIDLQTKKITIKVAKEIRIPSEIKNTMAQILLEINSGIRNKMKEEVEDE